ncbi:MAG TPA: hypothetical protein VEW69_06185, partial [Alphaproteobacteria bacterium]|nr:hypothetical protein [Alphaproteobacteria bacterium]
VNNGNAIGTLTIVGGRVQNAIKNIGASTRNVFFDRRYAQNGFSPPFFPGAQIGPPVPPAALPPPTIKAQRSQWLNQTSTY